MNQPARKQGRNAPCPCGSGRKYKHCCLSPNPVAKPETVGKRMFPDVSSLKRKPFAKYRSSTFIAGMAKASRLAKRCLREVETMMVPGMTGKRVERFVTQYLADHSAKPATLHYHGFPSACCVSPNHVVCHGIPNDKPFAEGDIVNVDLTPILNGYHGDVNETFTIGECSAEARKIVEVSRVCLQKGIEAARPYGRLGDIGEAIQNHAHAEGCSVVEKFVGHGIGRHFHEEPQVPHFGKRGKGAVLYPGMFFTIEPMINLGTKEVVILKDNWTAITRDRQLTAQFEHTLMVTKNSVRVLTAESDDSPLV